MHADVEACLYPLYLFCGEILSNACGRRGMPVSSVSVLWRNSLQCMRTLRHSCILFICLAKELSPTHADVEACLYPLYLFGRGTLSNSCGRWGMPVSSLSVWRRNSLQLMRTLRHACVLCICSVDEFSPSHRKVEACLYPLSLFCVCGEILSNSRRHWGMLCILCICSVEEFSPTHADVEACSVSSVYVLWRNYLQLTQMLRNACILFICSVEEFSLSHVDVEACLYLLYLFCGGIISNAC